MAAILDKSGIKAVTFYVASPVECCDRCSAGISNVFCVTYRDGATEKYGSECINKILDAQPSIRVLFQKNAKLLRRYQDYVAVLSRPVEDMPRGSEYFGSGLYFIADSEGKDIAFKRHFFHPCFDAEKNASGNHYVVTDPEQRARKCLAEIEWAKAQITAEISRLESFLAKVMRSVKQSAGSAQ